MNEEIKTYITQHKDDLMSGMQDVAVLAERYRALSSSSLKLQKSVGRLKKEAVDSHELVRMKTTELERIHMTSTLIRQLRQFAHAKSQLDHLLQGEGEFPLDAKNTGDVRQLATAAKVLAELESLLTTNRSNKDSSSGDDRHPSGNTVESCTLHDISFVANDIPAIQRFGQKLRRTAQEQLIVTLKDRNQAAVATSLQVFFNLNCLPEIVLLAIDSTIRSFVAVTENAIELDSFASAHAELINSVSGYPMQAAGSASLLSSTAAPIKAKKGNFSQMRVAMREISYNWTSHIHEHAMQINVLQRVIAKKEDPTTHKKFSEVLRQTVTNNPSLREGRLLDVFWERLSVSLQELASEKIKAQPVAVARIYPCLRKAAVETLKSLELLSTRDKNRDLSAVSMTSPGTDFGSNGSSTGGSGQELGSGVFGNTLWTPSELVAGAIGISNKGAGLRKGKARAMEIGRVGLGSDRNSMLGSKGNDDPIESHGLITGLRSMRDRYLLAALGRMTTPVHQMFPEMAGYEGAVPSKRDLQALFKAIQSELVSASVEGDLTLLKTTCKEMQKSIHLVVTKVEGMTMTGLDSKKMSAQNSFAKTHQQEHNCQLVILLSQLKESLEKLPTSVVKEAMDTPGSSLAAAVTAAAAANVDSLNPGQSPHEVMYDDLSESIKGAVSYVEDLAVKQLLYPLVDSMTAYIRSVLTGLLKEGITSNPMVAVSDDDVECSLAAQTIVQQVPEMLKSHLLSLPKSQAVVAATEEFCLRVLASYISVAALVRPVNEMSRMRTAKDMAAIEAVVLPYCVTSAAGSKASTEISCPVNREFKAFRQLLFAEEVPTAPTASNSASSSSSTIAPAPSRARLLVLPFVSSLRPSTLLSYLISCGPSQLPSPHDNGNNVASAYLETLTHPTGTAIANTNKSDIGVSIRSLYVVEGDWRVCDPEMHCWASVQECLDVFLQRAVVADAAPKSAMRAWYEALMDIGGVYFASSHGIVAD